MSDPTKEPTPLADCLRHSYATMVALAEAALAAVRPWTFSPVRNTARARADSDPGSDRFHAERLSDPLPAARHLTNNK